MPFLGYLRFCTYRIYSYDVRWDTGSGHWRSVHVGDLIFGSAAKFQMFEILRRTRIHGRNVSRNWPSIWVASSSALFFSLILDIGLYVGYKTNIGSLENVTLVSLVHHVLWRLPDVGEFKHVTCWHAFVLTV